MVAKGHDFPDVVLGVVLDADATLRFPDFRAEERTFALVAQLAGRSGRGDARRAGAGADARARAPPRSATPPRHDAAGFLAGELERRRELGYPPFAHLIRIELAGGRRRARSQAAARAPARGARRRRCRRAPWLLGPAPRFRLRGRERRQLLVKAPERARRGRARSAS